MDVPSLRTIEARHFSAAQQLLGPREQASSDGGDDESPWRCATSSEEGAAGKAFKHHFGAQLAGGGMFLRLRHFRPLWHLDPISLLQSQYAETNSRHQDGVLLHTKSLSLLTLCWFGSRHGTGRR